MHTTKDWLNKFQYIGSVSRDGETVSSYQKTFPNECRILYETYENPYGGKSIISVDPLPLFEAKEGIYHLRPPTISFFATGFEDYTFLEKKIREEIIPTLKNWAIKTL